MPALSALLADLSPSVLPRAGVAYVHYLSFMLCFGALVLERRLIQAQPQPQGRHLDGDHRLWCTAWPPSPSW